MQWIIRSGNDALMQLLDGEYQIPIFSPNDVAILQLKGVEQRFVKIFIVLRMWVTTDVVTDIHNARGIVVEEQVHRQYLSHCEYR